MTQGSGDGYHAGFAVGGLDAGNVIGVAVDYHVLGAMTANDLFGLPIRVTQKVNILEAAPFARVVVAPRRWSVAPYLKGGFGLEYVMSDVSFELSPAASELPYKIEVNPSHVRDSSSWLGIMGGVGVMVPTSRAAGLGVEVLFHQIKLGGQTANMISVSMEYWRGPRH
jgi:hypothetical protein